MNAATPRQLSRTIRGVGALIVLVTVVIGVPMLLIRLGLVPHGLPSLQRVGNVLRSRDNGQLAAAVLGAAAWTCWALFTASLVPEIVAAASKRPALTLPGLGFVQAPAAALVAAVAVGFAVLPLAGGPARAAAAPPPLPVAAPLQPAAHHTATSQGAAEAVSSPRPAAPQSSRPAKTYEVRRHDTLWGIAERYLSNPLRYPEIATLNPTLVGPDNELTPGSVLHLPADAVGLPASTTSSSELRAHTAVTVAPGDTLWGIEERVTGHGEDWPKAWYANAGRTEPGGDSFSDPDHIEPGWTLTIPGGSATAPPRTAPPKPRSAPPQEQPSPHDPPRPHASSLPSPSSPTAESGPGQHVPDAAATHATDLAPVAFAGGGGLLLAGVSLTALVGYRRRQFRRRHPGRTIGGTPPELIRMERAVLASGTTGLADVGWLDQALRSLVQSVAADPAGKLPDVIAVCMTADQLTLTLTEPTPDAPAPWRADGDGERWSIRREDPLRYDADRRGFFLAPFPTLTSVGYTPSGEHWLLDLERIAALSLTGDAERCLNLARFLAAELAHNTWSEMLQVTLVGFGKELVAANPDRLTYTEDLPGAIAAVRRDLESVTAAMRSPEVDVLSGRLHDIAGDLWAPNVLLVAPHLAADTAGLDELLATMKAQRTRASVALVLADDPDRAESTRWQLRVDSNGTLSIPALGVELIAQQVPASEAAELAEMLALAAISDDQPIPAAHGDQPWDSYADACGGLAVSAESGHHPSPHGAADIPVLHLAESAPWTRSLLPLSPQTYLERAATTMEDLRALAPVVDDDIRAQVERADPDLDADLDAWHDPACPRPRVTLLGSVRVRAQNSLPERSPQEPFHTEVVAYLATRTHGALSTVYAETMWPNDPGVVGKTKVRQSIAIVRKWLGRDPVSGEEYLPSGLHESGPARYRITGALVDAELFRRLRLRGLSRGPDGVADLWRALELVQGHPLSDIPADSGADTRGPGGYLWVTDANSRLDHEYSAMIVDTAHTVAIHHFGAGEPECAAQAAQVSLRGGSYEDVPLLDLVKACLLQRKEAEAEAYVRQIMCNHDAEIEEDLPPRTAEVLFRLRKQWVDRAS